MAPISSADAIARCRLCGCLLAAWDDQARCLCESCQQRPEARTRPAIAGTSRAGSRPAAARLAEPIPCTPPPFTSAERALIRNVHGAVPAAELVRILNDRQAADLGAAAVPHTVEQLHAAVADLIGPDQAAADWAGLREVLAMARRTGVLALVTTQLIDDFSVVYQLTAAQRLHVLDVIRHAQEVS